SCCPGKAKPHPGRTRTPGRVPRDPAGRTRFTEAAAPSARELDQPVARVQVILQAGLGAAGRRREAVLPAHQRRQAHQDRLAAAAGLEAEQGAAVPEQVELDVAPAPVELELALAFAVPRVATAFDDRHVRVEETVADRAQVVEIALEVRVQV